ncbi:MAG: hypothetical protein BHV70_03825 [Bacteroidales bacterium 55_9]|nr:MAG: hypothetical protein BHV70_03825 [Bacteroidales bacterium 55_9]
MEGKHMDRLTFFKQGLSSAMDAVSAVVGLKKAVNTFTEAVDEALGDIKSDMGLYLKSVESDMYEGVGSTLKEMARMGYTTIETDSYFGGRIYDLKPDDFRRAADEAGLKITSAHLRKYYADDMPEGPEKEGAEKEGGEKEGTETKENKTDGAETKGKTKDIKAERSEDRETEAEESVDVKAKGAEGAEAKSADAAEAEDPVMKWWDEALDVQKAMGCRYIVISRLPDALTPLTAARYADYYTRIGDKALQRGMKLCIHPERRVLTATDGASIFDIMALHMPQEKVWFEIDTREAHEAGVDIVSMLKRYKGRVMLLHLQDYGIVTESGLIDFDKIINTAINSGVKDIFVEVRSYTLPPRNCVERSMYNLESLPSLRY